MLMIASVALPVLLTVTEVTALVVFNTWSPNTTGFGLACNVGAVAAPMPDRFTTCGEFVDVPYTTTLAVLVPNTVGVNLTTRPHESPGATDWPAHWLTTANEPALAPTICT